MEGGVGDFGEKFLCYINFYIDSPTSSRNSS